MPKNSTMHIYGNLSLKPCLFDSDDFIFKQKKILGWNLYEYLASKNIFSKLFILHKLKNLLRTSLKTEIAKEFALENFSQALNFY